MYANAFLKIGWISYDSKKITELFAFLKDNIFSLHFHQANKFKLHLDTTTSILGKLFLHLMNFLGLRNQAHELGLDDYTRSFKCMPGNC